MSEPIAERPAAEEPGRDARRGFFDRSLVQLSLARFRELVREPEIIFWVFVFPVLMAGGLGVAFRNQPAGTIKVAATDAALAEDLRSETGLDVAVLEAAAGELALKTGRILLLATPGRSGVVYRFDDTNPEARTARMLADRAVQRSAGRRDVVPVDDDVIREPGSRYIDFVVPGLLGMNIMGGSVWGTGFTIVDARRRKLLKRLVASPMPRWQYLASFLISRLALLVIEAGVLLGFAVAVFGVPLRGSIWQLALLCLLASLCFGALGLLIGSRARTIEAASGLMNVAMMPMWILSGVFFSPERFPDAVQPLIRALPLTAVIDALRANMLRGEDLTTLTWQLPVILAWLFGSFALALWLFRWR
ncbi:MAG: ABC transporter permease [Planctomycetaceae bacterium]